MTGFLALPRAILSVDAPDAWFPQNLPLAMTYTVIANLANWRDAVAPLPKQKVPLKIGQLATSLADLAKKTGQSVQTIRSHLADLELKSKINTSRNTHGTIITVIDYKEIFLDMQEPQHAPQHVTNTRSTHGQQHQDKKTRRQEDKEELLATSSPPLRLVVKKEADLSAQLVEIWNTHRGALRAAAKLTDARRRKMRSRWTEEPAAEYWVGAVQKMAASSFCQEGSWATFDWLMKNGENHSKVAAGNYDDKDVTLQSQDWRDLLTPEERARL